VLPGFIKTAKTLMLDKPGGQVEHLVLEVQCEDPRFAGAETVSIFLGKGSNTIARINQIAAALGIVIPQVPGRIRLPKPEMFVGKPGLFVYSTYSDDRDGTTKPTITWGYPKGKNQSAEFDAWVRENDLTEEQKKKISKSPGVLPVGSL
jgi:hypothetical protein